LVFRFRKGIRGKDRNKIMERIINNRPVLNFQFLLLIIKTRVILNSFVITSDKSN